jgi:hypothetical protein
MDVPLNSVFKRQQDKLVPSTYKKGIITRAYTQAAAADVQIIGTAQTVLKRVPLAAHIDPMEIQVGSKCRVDQFDESNTNDMVIAYIYGATFRGPRVVTGSFTVSGSNATNVIAHGLGEIPDIYGYNARQDNDPSGSTVYLLWAYNAPDAQNLYYKMAQSGTLNIDWWAVKF